MVGAGAAADKELRQLVTDRCSTLADLHSIGPAGTARLLDDVAGIHRCRDRNRFASWNGTAPMDASSSGQQQRHRLSRAGNRKINRVLHTMDMVQLRRPSAGRTYYDRRRSEGKTSAACASTREGSHESSLFTCVRDHQSRHGYLVGRHQRRTRRTAPALRPIGCHL